MIELKMPCGLVRLKVASCSMALSLVGFASLEEATAQDALRMNRQVVKVLLDRIVTPERHPLIVREPDGQPARSLRIVKLSNDFRQGGDVDMPGLLQSEPMRLEEGAIELDLSNASQFYLLRSDSGIVAMAASRLLANDAIQLKSFGRLNVRVLRSDLPAAGVSVDVTASSTSDGMHQLRALRSTAMTDENGVAAFKQVPPGEVSVALDFQSLKEKYARSVVEGTASSAEQFAWVESGRVSELTFGQQTRPVFGKLELPKDLSEQDLKYFLARLVYSDRARLAVRLYVELDGLFACEDAPIGQADLEVQGVIGARNENFRDTHRVEVFAPPAGGITEQDLGVIKIKKRSSPAPITPSPSNKNTSSSEAAVTVSGSGPTEWIGLAFVGGRQQVVLMNSKGEIVVRPQVNLAGVTTAGYRSSIACDTARECFFVMTTNSATQRPQNFLTSINFKGQIQWQQGLVGNERTLALALDPSSGAVWVLRTRNADDSPNLLIFDSGGECIQKLKSSMTKLCYNPTDKAFWLAGGSTLTKIDTTSYRELATCQLPSDSLSINELISASDGGVYVVQSSRTDRPSSTNQLWKINREAQVTGRLDLGANRIISLLDVDGNLLASGRTERGMWTVPATSTVLRIKKDFSEYDVASTDVRSLILLSESSSHISCLAEKRLAKFSSGGEAFSAEKNAMPYGMDLLYTVSVKK